MPNAVSVDVADAVTSMLAAATLSQKITPERSYADWELPLETMDRLYVNVVAHTTKQKLELGTRGGSLTYRIPVDVCIRERLGQDREDGDTGRLENTRIDALMLLTQEVYETFLPKRLTTFEAGAWESTEIVVAPDAKLLRENRQFTSVVRVTFKVDRQL
ncbi:MAG: hypothetical protein HY000_14745 [Planctomycetes bacterium]|nr:hypothetical protein [Planctomycetota bacterium]